jgi:LysR family glycine cleavage system transcriptional activator
LRTLTDFPMPHRSAQVQPRVKVTVPPTFARYLLVPNLADFTQAHPGISIELFVSVPLYDLALSESDLEIRFGAGRYPNIITAKLFEEPAFAVVSPGYLEQIGPLAAPADLKRATLLRSAFEAAGLDWPEPSTGIRVDDLGLLLEAVKHGHGVGLSRGHFARDMLASGEVVRLFDVQLTSPPHAYYVVFEQQVRERPEVALFIDWLHRRFDNA